MRVTTAANNGVRAGVLAAAGSGVFTGGRFGRLPTSGDEPAAHSDPA